MPQHHLCPALRGGAFPGLALATTLVLAGCVIALPGFGQEHSPPVPQVPALTEHWEGLAHRYRAVAALPPSKLDAEIEAALLSEPTPATDELLALLWERLGEVRGREGLVLLEQIEVPRERNAAEQRIFAGWARTDSEGLWAWATAPETPAAGYDRIGSLVEALVDAGHLAFLASKLPAAEQAHAARLALHLTPRLVRYDPDRLPALAAEMPDPSLRTNLIRAYAVRWARADPQAAADWARTLPYPEGDAALREVLAIWRQTGRLDEVARWLLAQPPAPWLDHQLKRSATDHYRNLEVFEALVANIQDRRLHDEAVGGLAAFELRNSAEAAVLRAAEIRNPETRQTTLARHIQSWGRTDLEAAKEWVITSPRLTTAERGLLLQHLLRLPPAP